MTVWNNFFLGELSAAAALAGLLFVSVSVNRARILELGRMANRAIEALAMLFLVLIITSLALVPSQPLRVLGAEILAVAAATLIALIPLQRSYRADLAPIYRTKSARLAWTSRASVCSLAIAGVAMLWSGAAVTVYLLPVGILLTFAAVAWNAWVLLIEISR